MCLDFRGNEMNHRFLPRMPRPSPGGFIFNLLMLFAPWIGLWLGGLLGFVAGMMAACIGWTWFFFIYSRRGHFCEGCGRPIINMGLGSPGMEQMGLTLGPFFSTLGLRTGSEGPGYECLRCGRVCCERCLSHKFPCKCGSDNFRKVRLCYQ